MTETQHWFLALVFGAVVAFSFAGLRSTDEGPSATDGAIGIFAAIVAVWLSPFIVAAALGLSISAIVGLKMARRI